MEDRHEGNFLQYDELLSNLINNVSDIEIDIQIKNLNKYAKALKVKVQDIIIYADEDWTTLSNDIATIIKELNDNATLYILSETDTYFIKEIFPGRSSWLYFKSMEDADTYFSEVNKEQE